MISSAKRLSSRLKKSGSKLVDPEKIQQDCKDFQLDSKKINHVKYVANLLKYKK